VRHKLKAAFAPPEITINPRVIPQEVRYKRGSGNSSNLTEKYRRSQSSTAVEDISSPSISRESQKKLRK
jgi:hypothetical protein